MMMMMMGQQQQQHQPQPTTTTTTSTADQPTTTTTTISTADQEEEEEEFFRLWIGDMQHWMDEVEEEEKKYRTLWIGDLQHWMDEAYIHQCFVHTGEDFTSKVIRNNKKTTTECYGFIEFKSHAIAARFLNKFNGTPMPRVAGSSFILNWASSSSSSSSSGGEQQLQEEEEEEEEEEETFKHLDWVTRFYSVVYSYSCWEDMLMWWSIARGTRTLEAVRAAHRVYMIGAIFKCHNVLPDTVIEESLDELPRYVDFIDIAKELHSLDALDPILGELYNSNAGIRAKAAKLIITMAKKNHNCWQLVSEEIRAGLIYHTYFDERDPTVQSIALDAISSLFANDNPGISAFGLEGYVDLIRHVFEHGCVNRQRKALNLIARLVEEHNSDYNIVTELEYPSILMRLATSVDAELRKAAFRCLIVLARVEKGENSGQVVKNDEKLKQILQKRILAINAMAPEDLADERRLLNLLWNACHNEPSSL